MIDRSVSSAGVLRVCAKRCTLKQRKRERPGQCPFFISPGANWWPRPGPPPPRPPPQKSMPPTPPPAAGAPPHQARPLATQGAIARVLAARADPLAVLGLPPPAADARGRPSLACDEAAIHRAFRRAAATVHPDKHGGSEAARDAFEVVKDAHAALTTPARLEALLVAAAPAAAGTPPTPRRNASPLLPRSSLPSPSPPTCAP